MVHSVVPSWLTAEINGSDFGDETTSIPYFSLSLAFAMSFPLYNELKKKIGTACSLYGDLT